MQRNTQERFEVIKRAKGKSTPNPESERESEGNRGELETNERIENKEKETEAGRERNKSRKDSARRPSGTRVKECTCIVGVFFDDFE